jgi:hypothetical protein
MHRFLAAMLSTIAAPYEAGRDRCPMESLSSTVSLDDPRKAENSEETSNEVRCRSNHHHGVDALYGAGFSSTALVVARDTISRMVF